MAGFSLLLLITLLNSVIAADPLVTLQHGGQLRGKCFDYNGLNIDLFLGVPFADTPTGTLRFQKPRPARAWTGVRDAVTPGHFCPQLAYNSTGHPRVAGNEDCLHLDITVPGGVSTSTKKPVMVWIYGGGYIIGSKDAYPGATIAKHGDVIVVAINYRLAVLGFLSDGPGTGNYGLWDQRAALIWLQDNIAAFGGDPDMITIFGESAGAGSVAALMMGQRNDGLFKRAIQESGSLFPHWGWFSSERQRHELVEEIKRKGRCLTEETVYECLRGKTVEEIFAVVPNDVFSFHYHPQPDNDFFAADIVDESYVPSQSYDLLSGFCKQEAAGSILIVPTFLNLTQESTKDGLSLDYVILALTDVCKRTTPATVDMCINLFIDQYGLNSTDDDIERGIRLSFALGEIWFNADMVRQLSVHSQGTRSTYAYQFSENYKVTGLPGLPSWAKISAIHFDEVPFVFGSIYNIKNNITKEYTGDEVIAASAIAEPVINAVTASDKPLTDVMLTAWTNFAKTGDPNKPMSLPDGIPEWPEFDTTTNKFMELNSTNTQVITTPHKDRLDKVISTIFPARTAQFKADVVKASPTDPAKKGDGKDTVVG